MTLRPLVRITRGTLLRNSIWNFAGQIIPSAVAFFTVSYAIPRMGTERYGMLSLALAALGYFGAFELGLGAAVTKFLSEALGAGDESRIPQLFWSAATAQLLLCLVGTGAFIGMIPLLVHHVLNIPPGMLAETRGALYVLSLAVPLVYVAGSVRGVAEAMQRFDLVNAVMIPAGIAMTLVTFTGAYFGLRLAGFFWLLLGVRLAILLAFLLIAFRLLPSIKATFAPALETVRAMILYGGWFTLGGIIAPIAIYLDRFMIGSLLTISDVAYYTVPFDAMARLLILPRSLLLTLFPAFSALGRGKRDEVEGLFLRSLKYMVFLTGPALILVAVFAKDILMVWLGAVFASRSSAVLQILLWGVLLSVLTQTAYTLLQGLGRPDLPVKLALVLLPANMAVIWFCISRWGIVGAAWSYLIRMSLETVLAQALAVRLLGISSLSMKTHKMAPSLAVLLGMGGVIWRAALLETLGARLQFAAAALPLFFAVEWSLVFDAEDKGHIKARVRSLFAGGP